MFSAAVPGSELNAQVSYEITEKSCEAEINLESVIALDSLLADFGFGADANVDTLMKFMAESRLSHKGWRVKKLEKNRIVLLNYWTDQQSEIQGERKHTLNDAIWLVEEALLGRGIPTTSAAFGVNTFKKKPTIIQLPDGRTRFYLDKRGDQAYLSGTFNDWSTGGMRMTRVDSGWIADLNLRPGSYEYKFILDGYWMEDPGNSNRIRNEHWTWNSVCVVPNHEFKLAGYSKARKVILAGTFNGWNERDLKMTKTDRGWEVPVYLADGTYEYKYIVDGEWITDPGNPKVRHDGDGNVNSILELGESIDFVLKGFDDAKEVFLTGDFDGWRGGAILLERKEDRWEIPYVLGPGNYGYKFVVDGQWITDPDNPLQFGEEDYQNSLVVVQPNHEFFLEGFEEAKEVRLSGNFNMWADPGYQMEKVEGGWKMPLFMPVGKHLYKFQVDGHWILDPNGLREPNEHGTDNSMLWIKADDIYLR